MPEKNYDSTVMRMAGNIAAGYVNAHPRLVVTKGDPTAMRLVAEGCVELARAILAETLSAPPGDPEAQL